MTATTQAVTGAISQAINRQIPGNRFANKNYVAVLAKPAAANQCSSLSRQDHQWNVYWRIGKHRQGIFKTRIEPTLGLTTSDALIVAELHCMQSLLEENDAAGKAPSPKNMVLTFSGGGPAKLAAGTSTKNHLYPYAYFLKMRFAGAQILAEKNSDWISSKAEKATSAITIAGPRGEYLNLPGIGPVWITGHLMRQFRMRLNNQSYQSAWKVLAHTIQHCRFQTMPITGDASHLAVTKNDSPGQCLYDSVSRWVFVLTKVNGRSTLVTAYIKS